MARKMNRKTEVWRDVPGFPYLMASNRGRVKRKAFIKTYKHRYGQTIHRPYEEQILRPFIKRGYKFVCIRDRSVQRSTSAKHFLVNRMVCLAFHGRPPAGKTLSCHKNGIPTDNRPSNLYWGDQQDNADDAILHDAYISGEDHHRAVLDWDAVKFIREQYVPGHRGNRGTTYLADYFGVSRGAISAVVTNRSWKDPEYSKRMVIQKREETKPKRRYSKLASHIRSASL